MTDAVADLLGFGQLALSSREASPDHDECHSSCRPFIDRLCVRFVESGAPIEARSAVAPFNGDRNGGVIEEARAGSLVEI